MFGNVGAALANRLNRWYADVLLAVTTFVAMSVVGSVYAPEGAKPFGPLAYLLTALISLSLAVRRAAPVLVLVLVTLAYLIYLLNGHLPGLNIWGPVLAFYTVAATRPPRVTAPWALLMAAVLFYSGLTVPDLPLASSVAQAVVVPVAAWILGGVSRELGERNRELARITSQLRHEQQQRTERALALERLRIARELHDVVAHHMSVISMQAGLAGYVFDTDPHTARTAVDTIGSTGREALEEMRRMLNLLRPPGTPESLARNGDSPPEPTPGLDGLPALFDRVRAAGVEIHEEVSGPVDRLPSGLQLTAYRVIQEALTNVIKHAAPCRATVTLRQGAGALIVTITNEGAPVVVATDTTGKGHGLLGIRERAKLYGGNVTAGPKPDGGFVVALTIPTR